jgi:hypothetical protein
MEAMHKKRTLTRSNEREKGGCRDIMIQSQTQLGIIFVVDIPAIYGRNQVSMRACLIPAYWRS